MFSENGLYRGVVFQEGGVLRVVKCVSARKKQLLLKGGLSREGSLQMGTNVLGSLYDIILM